MSKNRPQNFVARSSSRKALAVAKLQKVCCDANTIVIGKNKSWKRSADMDKKKKQNFIGLPHAQMIDMIKYKANMLGITVICTNESYTSQTSALDGEKPCQSPCTPWHV